MSTLRIAQTIGCREFELRRWLESEAPRSWRDAYFYSQRELFRSRLKGLPRDEMKRRMAEWDAEQRYTSGGRRLAPD